MLAIGHSHLTAVQHAAARAERPLAAYNFWTLGWKAIGQEGPPMRYSDDIEDDLRAHGGRVFSLIGGAWHHAVALFAHPRPFDFVLPSRPELPLDARAECLPSGAVKGLLLGQMEQLLHYVARLGELCPGRVAHVEPPPPLASPKPFLDAQAAQHGVAFGELSPAWLRLKMWMLQSEILRAWCRERGVQFIACPSAAQDGDGFLREAYTNDGTHGNEAFGLLLLEEMSRWS